VTTRFLPETVQPAEKLACECGCRQKQFWVKRKPGERSAGENRSIYGVLLVAPGCGVIDFSDTARVTAITRAKTLSGREVSPRPI
jgi:hypothetical protein